MGNRAYDLLWGSVLRATTIGHKALDRVSGGRLGRRFPGGQQVVWITTTGRKSGQPRRTPLLAVREDGSPTGAWIVTGSNAGQSAVPAWVFNARADEDGLLEIDGTTEPVRFVEALGEDRDRLYAQLVAIWSSYAMYERNAGRPIPVFRILPR